MKYVRGFLIGVLFTLVVYHCETTTITFYKGDYWSQYGEQQPTETILTGYCFGKDCLPGAYEKTDGLFTARVSEPYDVVTKRIQK